MSEDSKAQAKPGDSVGQRLKNRRKALHLSLAQVEVDTKIRGKYLLALEASDYLSLPNDIYSRGFVQHYASHLGLDGRKLAADYVRERGGLAQSDTKTPRLENARRFVLTGPLVTLIGLVVVGMAVVWYLLWQFSALAAPPALTITSPDADRVLAGADITVAGRTTPGADISVNDSPVLTDTDGNFSEKVALEDGVNAIRITAHSKLGKSTTLTRNVLARLPKVDPAQAQVPTAVIPGVAVAVGVKEATSVVVAVDGKEAWRGTVVAGWSKVFTGAETVSLTTGNAGVTSVTVTNSVAAEKKISPLGRDGEIRRNQDFAKDTVIP